MVIILLHTVGRLLLAAGITTAVLALGGELAAQTSAPSPLSVSPLLLGSSKPVGATGIPLGSTELMVPGVSPVPRPDGCFSDPPAGRLTTIFDGGGLAGRSGCGPSPVADSPLPTPLFRRQAATDQASTTGIPEASTEIANLGLSPIPLPVMPFVSPLPARPTAAPPTMAAAPEVVTTPCRVIGVFIDQVTSRQVAAAESSAAADQADCTAP